jgi:hypothetical protein
MHAAGCAGNQGAAACCLKVRAALVLCATRDKATCACNKAGATIAGVQSIRGIPLLSTQPKGWFTAGKQLQPALNKLQGICICLNQGKSRHYTFSNITAAFIPPLLTAALHSSCTLLLVTEARPAVRILAPADPGGLGTTEQ